MKLSNELKTGIAVLAAVALLVMVLYQTGDLNYGKKGYEVVTRFGFAGGVKRFAPVRLSGVEVGEVRDINMVYNPEETIVEASLWIENGVRLREDSEANIATMGLMGEKYVEIKAGSSADFVSDGGLIKSKDPVSMDELIEALREVGDNVNLTLKDFRKLVNNTNEVVSGNKPKIDSIISNLEEASEYARDFTEDIKYHPWKVLSKGKELTPEEMAKVRAERRASKQSSRINESDDALNDGQEEEAEDEEDDRISSRGRSNFGGRRRR